MRILYVNYSFKLLRILINLNYKLVTLDFKINQKQDLILFI